MSEDSEIYRIGNENFQMIKFSTSIEFYKKEKVVKNYATDNEEVFITKGELFDSIIAWKRAELSYAEFIKRTITNITDDLIESALNNFKDFIMKGTMRSMFDNRVEVKKINEESGQHQFVSAIPKRITCDKWMEFYRRERIVKDYEYVSDDERMIFITKGELFNCPIAWKWAEKYLADWAHDNGFTGDDLEDMLKDAKDIIMKKVNESLEKKVSNLLSDPHGLKWLLKK